MRPKHKPSLLAPPPFIEPCLLTLVDRAPSGDRWVHEIKHDGYRLMVRVESGGVQLLTRSGLDWTSRFPWVAEAAAALPVENAYLDGEVVVADEQGRSDWPALHSCATKGRCRNAFLWAFDILFLNGEDLRPLPVLERKQLLHDIIPEGVTGIRYVEHLEDDGKLIFEHACKLGLEGIVSKLRDKPYYSGRSDGWRKAKCILREQFVIAGYLPLEGRKGAVGALILGKWEEGRLVRVGKAGTGFTARTASQLAQLFDAVTRPMHPFAERLPRNKYPGAVWVEPTYSAEIDFRGWSGDGLLRHASYKGLVAI